MLPIFSMLLRYVIRWLWATGFKILALALALALHSAPIRLHSLCTHSQRRKGGWLVRVRVWIMVRAEGLG